MEQGSNDNRMDEELGRLLAGYSEEIQSLTLRVRDLVLEVYPEAIEQVDLPAKIIGYGMDRTYRGMVCAIAPQRKYVNLMFARGTDLMDPEQLLEGTGKRARHVKIRNVEDAQTPAVRDLLKQAIKLAAKS
jgi:hypothetical protein